MLHESSKVWFDLACMSCLYVFILVFIVDSCGIVVCFMEFSWNFLAVSLWRVWDPWDPWDPWVRGRWPSRQPSLRRNLSCQMWRRSTTAMHTGHTGPKPRRRFPVVWRPVRRAQNDSWEEIEEMWTWIEQLKYGQNVVIFKTQSCGGSDTSCQSQQFSIFLVIASDLHF